MSVLDDREIAAASTVAEVLAIRARRHPAAPAILAPGRVALSYGALAELVDRTARAIAGAGLGRGKRVVVALSNGPEMAVALLAVTSCATCAPINPATDEDACRVMLPILRADAVVVREGEHRAVRRVAQALGLQIVEIGVSNDPTSAFVVNVDRRVSSRPADAPRPGDLALLMSTSGTTGRPKVIPMSQEDLIASMFRQLGAVAVTRADRCLCVAPLFTTSGIRRNLLSMIIAGGSIVCVNEFRAADFMHWIREFRPTYYAAAPAIHLALLEQYERGGPIGASSLRFVLSGAAPLPVDIERRLEHLLGVPVIQALGMSEAGLVASNPLPPGHRRPGSVGRPAGLAVAIHDEAGRALPALETGEIVLRGPGVIRHYEDNPEANRDAFRDGWFRTGDLGHFDDDGYLYLTGRVKELINRGGLKVSPYEVDTALLRHPEVGEAATFAVSHPTFGEDVNAAVVARAGSTTAQELRDFALERLAPYKVPSQILLVHALPKNPMGKVNRGQLAEQLAGALRERFTPPRTVRERQVARLFAAVLDMPDIGAFDNFFQLGGDSLRGARVVARLNAERTSSITTTLLFRRPTVAEFASALDAVCAADEQPGLPPIARLSRIGQRATAADRELGDEP